MENIEQSEKNNNGLKIKDFLWICLSKWYWFVLALVISIGFSIYKLSKTERIYTSTASLLIKDAMYGDDQTAMFSDMSSFGNHTNLNNEMVAMRSPIAMREVVLRSGAETNYLVKKDLRYEFIYGPTLPYEIKFVDIPQDGTAVVKLSSVGDSIVTVGPFAKDMDEYKDDPDPTSIKVALKKGKSDTIKTPLGRIVLSRNDQYKGNKSEVFNIIANHVGVGAAANRYLKTLDITVPDNYSSVLKISLNDYNPDRADVVLKNLIEVYNENWIKDRNQILVSTNNFIRDRLGVIVDELGSVDSDISSYKSANQITNTESATQAYFERSMEANDKILELTNNLQQARMVRDQLSNLSRKYDVLPASTGLSVNIESQIQLYNNKINERKNLLTNTSEDNPIIQDLNTEIDGARDAVLQAIDQNISDINTQIGVYRNIAGASTSQIAVAPVQEKNLLSKERQQKVKEELYLYLLQKREENELSQAFSAYNSKLLAPPTAEGPINVALANTLLMAFAIGLLIPALIIYVLELMNSKVRGRKDIEHLTIPFVGEIPLAGKQQNNLMDIIKKQKKPAVQRQVLVKKGSGNVINEAFRVIRTNLEFMVPPAVADARTIMLTSANPGSGKTFITLNLAAVLALKGKSVVMLDLDLRKASLSEAGGNSNLGLANYLTGQVNNINDIKVRNVAGVENVDLLPVGPIPPNPAELLYSEKLVTLIEQLKHEYDYVLIDCPPVEVVADAKIINRLVDLTLFIVRAGVLERDMLPEIQRFYDIRRYNNMALILNGTPDPSQSTFKRANRFGYGYGYGYGYSKKK